MTSTTTASTSISTQTSSSSSSSQAAAGTESCSSLHTRLPLITPTRKFGEYIIHGLLGKGAYGKVYLGTSNITGMKVALKFIEAVKIPGAKLEWLDREIKAMQTIHHRNVVKLLSYHKNISWIRTKGNVTLAHLVVLELADGGSFIGVLRSEKFSAELTRTYTEQLIQGLKAIHDGGYVHRDIKPENLLLSHDYVLKISDFGLSKRIDSSGSGMTYTPVGTRLYMAPEITTGRGYDGKAADIWSAGFIIFVMLFGVPPWASVTDWYYQKWMRQSATEREQFWSFHQKYAKIVISSEAKNMLEGMLTITPKERITMDRLLKHPFFTTTRPLETHELIEQMSVRCNIMRAREQAESEHKRLKKAAEAARALEKKIPEYGLDAFRSYNDNKPVSDDDAPPPGMWACFGLRDVDAPIITNSSSNNFYGVYGEAYAGIVGSCNDSLRSFDSEMKLGLYPSISDELPIPPKPAPAYPFYKQIIPNYTTFKANETPTNIITKIKDEITRYPTRNLRVNTCDYVIRCGMMLPSGALKFTVKVFLFQTSGSIDRAVTTTSPSLSSSSTTSCAHVSHDTTLPSLHLVEFQRNKGDIGDFCSLYDAITSRLTSMIEPANDVTILKAITTPITSSSSSSSSSISIDCKST